jgi:transaldolase
VQRRIDAELNPVVGSVASLFVSRWDVAVADKVPADLKGKLGLAVGLVAYRSYRQTMASERWQKLRNDGARSQRLLWASTGTKDPDAPDTLYVHGLAAPFTINTMPDSTLEAFFDHGEAGDPMPADGAEGDELLSRFAEAGIDTQALAAQLQSDGAKSFVDAWNHLMERVDVQHAALT